MQTNTLVFIVFVVVMCCALASLIYRPGESAPDFRRAVNRRSR